MIRLVTIPFSHYCEKARWALERAKIPFREDGHLPLFAWGPALAAGRNRTVPVLVADGKAYPDSTDILRWADRDRGELYPREHEAEVLALEDLFDQKLGPATRRIAYWNVLHAPELMNELMATHGPRWQATLVRIANPLVRGMLARGMKIDEEGVARSRAVVDRVYTQVADLLADGRRFLVGNRFTAADLTFAALSVPILHPKEAQRWILPESRFSPSLMAEVESQRSTPAGQFALRIYKDHR